MSPPALQLLQLTANLVPPVGLALMLGVVARQRAVRARVEAYVRRLDRRLDYLQRPRVGLAIYRSQVALAAVFLVACALRQTPAPLLLLPAVAIVPAAWLDNACARRTTRIEQQLDGFLLSLANALKLTGSIGDGIATSTRLMTPPIAQELELVLKEHALGTPLDRALQTVVERVRSPVVSGALLTLRVARTTGGSIGDTLQQAAATLREMARLEGVVRSKTAEGRAQTALISLVPGGLFLLIDSLDPELLRPLKETDSGHLVLAAAAALWLCALLWARRIVAVEV